MFSSNIDFFYLMDGLTFKEGSVLCHFTTNNAFREYRPVSDGITLGVVYIATRLSHFRCYFFNCFLTLMFWALMHLFLSPIQVL